MTTCRRCATCCVAPDIGALDKPLGAPCPRLGPDGLCTDYAGRPDVCRSYRPDELCNAIAAPTLEERVARYLALFGLSQTPGNPNLQPDPDAPHALRARPVPPLDKLEP